MQIKTRVVMTAVAGALIMTSANGSAAAQGAVKAPLNDPTIVAIFDAANTWDMETGGMGATRGTTQAVRDFGKMLVRDHRTVRQQGRDLAAKLHVVPTPPKDFAMAKDHRTAAAMLKATKRRSFDRAFLEHEVAYHKAVIDAMNTTLLPALQNAEVKALVTKVAPAFQAHILAAQTLLDKLPKR